MRRVVDFEFADELFACVQCDPVPVRDAPRTNSRNVARAYWLRRLHGNGLWRQAENKRHTRGVKPFVANLAEKSRLLYGFVVLCHQRRRVVHVNVTAHPTAAFVAQQLREAFPFDPAPKYLIRDRDSIYGEMVRRCLRSPGVAEVVIAPRSPWQNPYVERFFGTLRRECLNHLLVLNERYLLRILREFLTYYHEARTPMALGDNAPEPRAVEPLSRGRVRAIPYLGGLLHRYTRRA
jgi:transposase InsO family protein